MALFGSLTKWALGHKEPGIIEPDIGSSEDYARQSLAIGKNLLADVQGLETARSDFLTGQITKRQNIFAPWLSAFGKNLGETSTALAAGNLPPDIAKAYERAGRSAAFGGGFGYAPKAGNLAALFGAEGALRGIATGVSTAQSWLALMNNIYAPATVNYAEKYLPSFAQTATHETQKELTETSYRNLARQFEYATDPLTGKGGVYEGIENFADTIGTALSVYLGGLGGIGGMAGGLAGMGSGGGGASAMSFLQGIYTPGTSASMGGARGETFTPGRTSSWFGFGGNPTSGFDY